MLGIVLLNYNSYIETVKCVESIRRNTHIDYKIYLVDNLSTDDSYSKFVQIFINNKKIEVIQSGKNGGYSFGNNIGIKKALKENCDAVLISNTDIVYYENSIDSMYIKLRKNENVAVVGPKLINPNGQYSQVNIMPPSIRNYWFSKKPFSLFAKKINNTNKNRINPFYGMVQGSSFIIKGSVIKKINYLDDNVFLFGEEKILAYKLKQLNLMTLVDNDSTVEHNHSTTISREGKAFERFHMYYSNLYILRNYLNAKGFQLSIAIIYNLIFWMSLSFFYKSYRIKLIPFIKQTVSLLKYKK